MTTPEAIKITQRKLRNKGLRTEADLVREVTQSGHEDVLLKKKKLSSDFSPVPYTLEEALAYFMDNNLSKNQYINTRVGAKKRKADIYPRYSSVVLAKKACYPKDICVTETKSSVPLQSLLNHNSERIFNILSHTGTRFEAGEFKLLGKWGLDGSSDQALYRQSFSDPSASTSKAWNVTRYVKYK